jgi:hypothetical protein
MGEGPSLATTLPPGRRLDEPQVIEIPADAHTYRGFLEWALSGALPEKLPVMLLDGTVSLDLSVEPLQTHVAVKAELYCVLAGITKEEDLGEFYVGGVLIGNEEAGVWNNPDGVFVGWDAIKSGRVRFVVRGDDERAVEGSPDWIVEIVSDNSVKKDNVDLRAAYHRAKVREYWLIDARVDPLTFTVLLWRKNGYIEAPGGDGWVRSKVFGREFRLTRKRNRRQAWDYTLETRRDDG